MKEKNGFYEQYRDPRWQKKRLKILDRDKFTCQSCGEQKEFLNIHHRSPYEKDLKVWEYENEELITFCESCHKQITEDIKQCRVLMMSYCTDIESSGLLYLLLQKIHNKNPYELTLINEILESNG